MLAESPRRGVFTIVIEFKGGNDNYYVKKHHHNPQHFLWTAMANDRKKSPAQIHAQLANRTGQSPSVVLREPGDPTLKLQENFGTLTKYLIETGTSAVNLIGRFAANRYEKS